jgi:single-strand DNA-binding protein
VARSLNKAMLIGNVGQDPEIRTIPSGARVAQFSVATSRRWNDKSGQQQEKTEWHRIVAWENSPGAGGGKLVEIIERYVKKGDRIYVEGEIEYRQYQDKDNVTKYTTEIRAREVVLLGGKSDGGGGDWGGSRPAAAGARAGGAAKGGSDYDDFQAPPLEDDDDLPF